MQKHVSSKHTFPKGAACGQKHNRVTLWAKNYLHYIQNYFWLDMQTDTKSADRDKDPGVSVPSGAFSSTTTTGMFSQTTSRNTSGQEDKIRNLLALEFTFRTVTFGIHFKYSVTICGGNAPITDMTDISRNFFAEANVSMFTACHEKLN